VNKNSRAYLDESIKKSVIQENINYHKKELDRLAELKEKP
jgi:hypothetical protein